MAHVTSVETLHWKNRFVDHPAVAFVLDPAVAQPSGTPSERSWLRAAVEDLFPLFPWSQVSGNWQQFTVRLALDLHRRVYSAVAEACGVSPEGPLWFATRDHRHGAICAELAAQFSALADRAAAQQAPNGLDRLVANLVEQAERNAFDQMSRAILDEAERRGIPWARVAGLNFIRFGHGHRQKRQLETLTERQSSIGQRLCRDKLTSLRILSELGIPVGRIALAASVDDALRAAPAVGFPLVVKPNSGTRGAGVAVGLTSLPEVREAASKIAAANIPVLLQSFMPGDDHRILVVDGKVIAVARREPAHVVGDGLLSVQTLIDIANKNPMRGSHWSGLMNRIAVDDDVVRVLAAQGLTLSATPTPGQKVMLRRTANISTGGSATDFTQIMHPDNRVLAERAALALGLSVAAIDFITPDITRSWRDVGGGVCEVNGFLIGLRPHWLANPQQNVVAPIVDLVFPPGDTGRIPIALIAGSNGKTTTTRMLAGILRAAGHRVGSATTDGVRVDDDRIADGDFAGVTGASMILREPTVTAAALETARGGILKRGIFVDRCDVAALLNVDFEQVGIDGIETVEQMAAVKRRVIDTATEGFVLNADDIECQRIIPDLPPGKVIVFTTMPDGASARSVFESSGTIVVTAGQGSNERIEIRRANAPPIAVMSVSDIPATLNGMVRHNVENALAAVGMATAMGIGPEIVAEGLRTFAATVECSPGRFNLLDGYPRPVLLDHASNPPALRRAVEALGAMPRTSRRILAVTSPGNRPDDSICENARTVAPHADIFICYEDAERRRGREERAIVELLAEGLREAGVASDAVVPALSQDEAIRRAVELAISPDDLIIIFNSDVKTTLEQFDRWFRELGGLPRTEETSLPAA